jgi:hypothetical protein
VDQEVAVVYENPFRRVVSLDTHRQFTGLLQTFFNLVAHSVPLPGVRNRADNEIIGEGSNLAKIKNLQIEGLPGFGPPCCNQPVG